MSKFPFLEEKEITGTERINSEGSSSSDYRFVPETHSDNEYSESYSSHYSLYDDKTNLPVNTEIHGVSSSKLSQKIYRAHYSKRIITAIEWLSENHKKQKTDSINCIAKLLSDIKEFINISPKDPYGSFLLALYDGISHNNSWINLDNQSFKKISKYVKEMTRQELNYKKVDKYIMKLGDLGLNILPY